MDMAVNLLNVRRQTSVIRRFVCVKNGRVIGYGAHLKAVNS